MSKHSKKKKKKEKTAKLSFVCSASTWLLASAHLEAHFFPPPCSRMAQCLRREKKKKKKKQSYLAGVCVRARWQQQQRWCAKRGYFVAGTAALSESLQGSHIRGNVIHSLAPPASRLMNSGRITTSVPSHSTPTHIAETTSPPPLYDSICLSISRFPGPVYVAVATIRTS